MEKSYKKGRLGLIWRREDMEDALKKKLQKMEGMLYKFRTGEIEFPELIKRLEKIEEFYND